MGPGRQRGSGLESTGILWEEGSVSQWESMLVFQAEVFAIMACVNEIQMNARPDKYVSYLL